MIIISLQQLQLLNIAIVSHKLSWQEIITAMIFQECWDEGQKLAT